MLILAALFCLPAHAADEPPPEDLLELLGEADAKDSGWFESLMSKIDQKEQDSTTDKGHQARRQEAKNAKSKQ
jgi:hypothetical protein